MDVIALVGPSGTGKSHHALIVAHKHKADAIIDDGILIKDGKILGGHSAKKEKSKIMAVRRAIFVLPGHAEEVRAAIQQAKPHRIMILGTSENMVQKIAKALQLPSIAKIIHIEDVATKQEMEKAQFYRLKQGKHIIPVPTIELKPHFSGYLVDPLQTLFKRSPKRRRRLGEKSIVRPVFSYYGKLSFSDRVIASLVRYAVKGMKKVRITGVSSEKSESQMNGLTKSLERDPQVDSILRNRRQELGIGQELRRGQSIAHELQEEMTRGQRLSRGISM